MFCQKACFIHLVWHKTYYIHKNIVKMTFFIQDLGRFTWIAGKIWDLGRKLKGPRVNCQHVRQNIGQKQYFLHLFLAPSAAFFVLFLKIKNNKFWIGFSKNFMIKESALHYRTESTKPEYTYSEKQLFLIHMPKLINGFLHIPVLHCAVL